MNLVEDLIIHDTLNPKLWDTSTNKLLPEVRKKLLEIVSAFEKYLEFPMQICDVQLCGSSASYNYHDKSDIDLHIIANFEHYGGNDSLAKKLFEIAKSSFNNKYDITIKGLEVEVYVQDVNSAVTSNGIYSVCDDSWIKEPKPIKSIKKHDNSDLIKKWEIKINNVIKSGNIDQIQGALNTLYLIRHNAIARDGEYSAGNQLFKDIRSKGLLEKLKDAIETETEKQLSLESFEWYK